MADGEYVGIALANPTRLTAINFKSTLADTYEVLYSLDGKVWNKVEADGAAPEGYVHYVVLVNKSGENRRSVSEPMYSVSTLLQAPRWPERQPPLPTIGKITTQPTSTTATIALILA